MRKYFPLFALVPAIALVGCDRPAAPVSPDVARWVETCVVTTRCYGDIYYTQGNTRPFRVEDTRGSTNLLLALRRNPGKVERIVKLDGDPAAYMAAARDFYRRAPVS